MTLGDATRAHFDELPLGLLDRPQLDARIARDPEKLDELADNIRLRGLIFPIAVVPVGDRYEVVDGFRRFLACQRAGLVVAPCRIYPTKSAALEGVKYAANAFREDMSPADEAIFFHELWKTECGADVDRVCALVDRRRGYVEARINLLLGDDQVFEALRARKITIGVAEQLNKLPAEDYRRYYLDFAIRDGATVATVSAWVLNWHKDYGGRPPAPAEPASAPSIPIIVEHDPLRCYICQKADPRYLPKLVSVHDHCRLAILDPILASWHASQGEAS